MVAAVSGAPTAVPSAGAGTVGWSVPAGAAGIETEKTLPRPSRDETLIEPPCAWAIH
jgi:hypothetical protein